MPDITIYVIDKEKFFSHERRGDIDSIMLAVERNNEIFTLSRPPNQTDKWRWIDNKWIKSNNI